MLHSSSFAQREIKVNINEALQSGNAFIVLAAKSGVNELMRQAEEVVGTVFLQMEQYPDALAHFLNAKSLADTSSFRAYESVNAAETLWKLGRYTESDAMLQFEPGNEALAARPSGSHFVAVE